MTQEDVVSLLVTWIDADLLALRDEHSRILRRMTTLVERRDALLGRSPSGSAGGRGERPLSERADAARDGAEGRADGLPGAGGGGLSHLGLSRRIGNALTQAGIKSVADLARLTPEELRQTRGIGVEATRLVADALARLGMSLAVAEGASDAAVESQTPGSPMHGASAGDGVREAFATPSDNDEDGNSALSSADAHVEAVAVAEAPSANGPISELLPDWRDDVLVRLRNHPAILPSATIDAFEALIATDRAVVSEQSGYDVARLAAQMALSATQLRESLEGNGIALGDEVRQALRGISDRDLEAVERRYGFNGATPETLDEIGSAGGVTRERVRQRVVRFVASARDRHPPLFFSRQAIAVLQRLGRPVTLIEWASALPASMGSTSAQELLMLRELEGWGWLEPNSWVERDGVSIVAAGPGRDDEAVAFFDRFVDTTALPFQLGAVRVADAESALGLGEAAVRALLLADEERWTPAPNGWFVRTALEKSFLLRRARLIAVAIGDTRLEDVYQSLKRIVTDKYAQVGWRMPPRALFVRMLQAAEVDGMSVDTVHEMLRASDELRSEGVSATTQALVNAFGADRRALTAGELAFEVQQSGLSTATATVAAKSSPVVVKYERGVYGLVGRPATRQDIEQARARSRGEPDDEE